MKTNGEEKIPNEVYKLLRRKLNEYSIMQDKMLEIENEICPSSRDINSSIRSLNRKSSGVENMAIKLAENKEYQELQSWKKHIDALLIYYIDSPEKLKFIKRRYIDCELLHFSIKNKIKDIDVIKDLEIDGYLYSERTWIRWKNEILNKLYNSILKDKILKKYKFF